MVSETRPGRARQRHRTAKIGTIPILFQQPANCGDLQQSVITTLVYALVREFGDPVNYDHVTLTITKSPVPIQYRNHKYDVACLIGRRVILIDVLDVPAGYWERAKEAGHGKGQE